jgi:hypothetical protein
MPVILSCSLSLYRADVFFAMPTKPVAKKPISGKPQAVKPAQKNVVQKKPAPDKTKGLARQAGYVGQPGVRSKASHLKVQSPRNSVWFEI